MQPWWQQHFSPQRKELSAHSPFKGHKWQSLLISFSIWRLLQPELEQSLPSNSTVPVSVSVDSVSVDSVSVDSVKVLVEGVSVDDSVQTRTLTKTRRASSSAVIVPLTATFDVTLEPTTLLSNRQSPSSPMASRVSTCWITFWQVWVSSLYLQPLAAQLKQQNSPLRFFLGMEPLVQQQTPSHWKLFLGQESPEPVTYRLLSLRQLQVDLDKPWDLQSQTSILTMISRSTLILRTQLQWISEKVHPLSSQPKQEQTPSVDWGTKPQSQQQRPLQPKECLGQLSFSSGVKQNFLSLMVSQREVERFPAWQSHFSTNLVIVLIRTHLQSSSSQAQPFSAQLKHSKVFLLSRLTKMLPVLQQHLPSHRYSWSWHFSEGEGRKQLLSLSLLKVLLERPISMRSQGMLGMTSVQSMTFRMQTCFFSIQWQPSGQTQPSNSSLKMVFPGQILHLFFLTEQCWPSPQAMHLLPMNRGVSSGQGVQEPSSRSKIMPTGQDWQVLVSLLQNLGQQQVIHSSSLVTQGLSSGQPQVRVLRSKTCPSLHSAQARRPVSLASTQLWNLSRQVVFSGHMMHYLFSRSKTGLSSVHAKHLASEILPPSITQGFSVGHFLTLQPRSSRGIRSSQQSESVYLSLETHLVSFRFRVGMKPAVSMTSDGVSLIGGHLEAASSFILIRLASSSAPWVSISTFRVDCSSSSLLRVSVMRSLTSSRVSSRLSIASSMSSISLSEQSLHSMVLAGQGTRAARTSSSRASRSSASPSSRATILSSSTFSTCSMVFSTSSLISTSASTAARVASWFSSRAARYVSSSLSSAWWPFFRVTQLTITTRARANSKARSVDEAIDCKILNQLVRNKIYFINHSNPRPPIRPPSFYLFDRLTSRFQPPLLVSSPKVRCF